jgi:chorismate--pyruvate lyase
MTRWTRVAPAHSGPWRGWLAYRGSLTQRIVERSRSFRVEVSRQGSGRLHEDEHRAVGLRSRLHAHVREVVLFADAGPVVVARSVVAHRHVRGVWRPVAGLGSRPLAAVLFADRRVQRRAFEFACLDRGHPLWRRARAVLGRDPGPLPARRSVFQRHGKPIMVTEVFLPTLLELGR